MKWCILASAVVVALTAAGSAAAEPIRILIAASHTRGAEGELPLRHSAEDADQVRSVLTSLGGFSAPSSSRLVDPSAAALRAAIDRARAVAARHTPDEVTFVLYFSGHGDRDHIWLGDESIAMTELSESVRSVPAALRLLVTDACRNEPWRVKGFHEEPAFTLTGTTTSSRGVVWLFAADSGEPAQESDELQGALFTHYWVDGLRGAADANGDGRVTLAESYEFAFSQTLLRSARSSGVLQHPTATFALTELAPVVMTETSGNASRFVFPPSADVRYLVYNVGSRSVLAEVWSRPDRSVALAVPAGRYIVQWRGPSRAGAAPETGAAADVALASGEERTLTLSDFRRVPEEQLAAKGGEIVLRPNELAFEIGAGIGRMVDLMAVGGIEFRRALGSWAVAARARGAVGVERTGANQTTVSTAGVSAWIESRWRLGGPVLALGAGAGGEVVHQRVARTDARAVALAGYATVQGFTSYSTGPLLCARLRLPVGTAGWFDLGTEGQLSVARVDGLASFLWTSTATMGLGVSF